MNNNLQLVLKSSTTEMSLNDHSAGIYLTPELDGLTGLPEIRTTSGVNAGYDGGWTSAQKFDARSIVIRGTIANNDKTEVERMRRELVALLAQGKNEQLELDFVTETGRAYEVQVRTIACDMALQKVLTQQDFMITLRADDPLIYDNSSAGEEATVNISGATGGFRIPFEIPLAIDAGSEETLVENTGLEAVAPTVKMYGALHNPKIINHTTNQSMQIQAELGFAEGDWITPSDPVEGKDLTINGAPENALIADFGVKGDTSQNGTPTPSAPVAVQTVTGENVVEIYGKNLFNKNKPKSTYYIDGSGNAVDAGNYEYINQEYSVSGGEGMTVSFASKAGAAFVRIAQYRGDGTFIQRSLISTSPTTVTLSSDARKIILSVNQSNALYFTDLQVEYGSATAYEPYQSQSYEVNLGKNLFDKDNTAQILDDVYINTNESKLDTSGGAGTGTIFISCSPNTAYTVSKILSSRFILGTTAELPANGVVVSGILIKNNQTSATITTGSNAKYLCIYYRRSASDSVTKQQLLDSIQIELGSQASSYAAYFTPIELCKIGTYQDYIYKSGGKWYVHKETGAKHPAAVSSFVFSNGCFQTDFKYPSDKASQTLSLSSHFRFNPVQTLITNNLANGEYGWNTSEYLTMKNAALTSKADWETWLSSNDPVVYYALATPTDTEITNEALVAQLEAILQEARMHNQQTNITTLYADGNEQATLSVSYFTVKNPDVRDELIIDSRLRTITLNGLDVYHLQAPGSEFLMLAPGENKLSLQSDIVGDNGYAKVSYKQGYLSI